MQGFKDAMAASLGGGGAVSADKVIIDDITGARRRLQERRRLQSDNVNVEFHIVAPAAVATQATSLVAAVAIGAPLEVNGVQADLSTMAAPVVTQAPNVNCVGDWSACDDSCTDAIFTVVTTASGTGADCEAAHFDTRACSAGQGACPAVDCVGSYSDCNAQCSKTFTVETPASTATDDTAIAIGNVAAQCAADDGAVDTCSPGEGACPAPPPPVRHTLLADSERATCHGLTEGAVGVCQPPPTSNSAASRATAAGGLFLVRTHPSAQRTTLPNVLCLLPTGCSGLARRRVKRLVV